MESFGNSWVCDFSSFISVNKFQEKIHAINHVFNSLHRSDYYSTVVIFCLKRTNGLRETRKKKEAFKNTQNEFWTSFIPTEYSIDQASASKLFQEGRYNFPVCNSNDSWKFSDFLFIRLISALSSFSLILSYVISKLKLPINNKLHALLASCFFLISDFLRCGFTAISRSVPHQKLWVKAGCKLKNVGKHWIKS